MLILAALFDWKAGFYFRNAKTYLSLCVCIQLFKILKFADVLVPKVGLATSVLRNLQYTKAEKNFQERIQSSFFTRVWRNLRRQADEAAESVFGGGELQFNASMS